MSDFSHGSFFYVSEQFLQFGCILTSGKKTETRLTVRLVLLFNEQFNKTAQDYPYSSTEYIHVSSYFAAQLIEHNGNIYVN